MLNRRVNIRFIEYRSVIDPLIPTIKEQIKKSDNGEIAIRISNIKNIMGNSFISKDDTTIIWALRYILFFEGIIATQKRHKDGSNLLIMRTGNEDDTLPDSMLRIAQSELTENFDME